MKLYELTSEWLQLIDDLDAIEDGIVPPEIAARLVEIEQDVSRKADGICRLVRGFEGEALALKAEEDRLSKRRRSAEARATWLKDYLKAEMERLGETKLQTELFKVAIQNNSQPSVAIINESLVPRDFDLPAERKIDRKAIAARWQDGQDVPGTEVSKGTHLRIR